MIAVRALKAGTPTGDITMELCSDSAGIPGTVLETVNVAGDTLAEDMQWVEFEFTSTINLSFATTYWIVVRKATPIARQLLPGGHQRGCRLSQRQLLYAQRLKLDAAQPARRYAVQRRRQARHVRPGAQHH